MNHDVLIIGAGPAGIFTALELLKQGSRKKILMIEKGSAVEKRSCPKSKTGKCVNCRPYCHITTGFSGAGAFSDGKLSLSCEVGGDLPQLLGTDRVQALTDYTDSIYLEFGADPHVEGLEVTEEIFFLGPTTGVVEQKCEELHGPDGEITRRVEQGQLCAIRTTELIRRGDQLYKFVPTEE